MSIRSSLQTDPSDHKASETTDGGPPRARAAEPIAVVGIACRLPGDATSPERFWRLLLDGVDAVREVPADRWDIDAYFDADWRAPGKMSTRWGGFLERVDGFDPAFFGVSPREAVEMDPQQRLMLELAWEAIEDAGTDPARLRGSATGVFVGAMWTDYARSVEGGVELITQHTATGQDSSVLAGRVSYVLGLTGPSLSVNTAASSSLVAVQLACQSLRAGEATAALAGGVNLILAPHSTVAMSKFGGMSPDGRCKAFDARANGYVRGEGGGLVLLKRLSDALRDGDRIYSVIRGGAINNDGASSSLTAPSPEAQRALLRVALANAGIDAGAVSYVEAHGTGTALGDPIEAGALGAVLGAARSPESPLRIGSVKTNIGHLEAAAGIAGLIKVVLAVYRGTIPASLHFERPNPNIDFEGLRLQVQTAPEPWPDRGGPRVAGVSSFGFGGTNCHLVVEQAQPPRRAPEKAASGDRPLHIVTLSGNDEGALRERTRALQTYLAERASVSLADVGHSTCARRGHLPVRIAVLAEGRRDAAESLLAWLESGADPAVIDGPADGAGRPPRVAFVFPGQGPQHPGMGLELYRTHPVFREALDRCAAILEGMLPVPLLRVMHPGDGDDPSLVDDTRYTQPALFAVSYALVTLWRSWGVEPAAVLGHSMGELTAAHVAGVCSLEDGLKLAVERGRWMYAMPAGGRMVFVRASEQRVAELVAPRAAEVSIAAINGPEHTVVSGAGEAVAAIVDTLRAEGVEATDIKVSLASHSPLVAPVADAYGEAISDIAYAAPRLPLISNVTGALADARVATPRYWVDHLRSPVRFGDGMAALGGLGIDVVIEMSPHPTLLGMAREAGRAPDVRLWLPSLRRGSPEWATLLRSVASLYTHGAALDWAAFDLPYARRLVDLPTYPFQRSRFWLEPGRPRPEGGERAPGRSPPPAEVAATEETGAGIRGAGRTAVKSVVERLAGVEPAQRRAALGDVVRAAAGKLLGQQAGRVPTDRPWRALGFDSLMAAELRNTLAVLLGKGLPSTLLFDFPTVASLTDHLLQDVGPALAAAPAPAAAPADEPIAIVGMACRFPGGVTEPEQLADLLAAGRDVVTNIPKERWDGEALYNPDVSAPGRIATRWGGFLEGVDLFDAAFFGVTPTEARSMDPHQRLLLEVSVEALDRAGQPRHRLAGSNAGVFIGISSSDFEARTLSTARSFPPDPYGATGRMRSGTAGRLSYWLGLRGPSVAVDTACASALTAIHLACQSLRARECHLALAGAAHLMLSPENLIWLSQAGGLSPTGKCRSFDAAADGYALSEGCGVVVLKRLVDAEAAGDPILSIVRGSAVNHGGQSNGLTAPSGPAQRALLRRALAQACLAPADVQYVEAHGTGTRMGDAIETLALAEELGKGRLAGRPLLIGSLKPNLGHTQAAAGIAGVIKVLLAFQRSEIPPTIHLQTPSPDVPWDEVSVRVVTSPTPWPRDDASRRMAGVSAFGMTGANAHVLLEEPPPRPRRALCQGPFLVVVSGRTEASLLEAARRLRDWVTRRPEAPLDDIAYTACVRRSHYAVRAGLVASDGAALVRALDALVAGEASDAVVSAGLPVPEGGALSGEEAHLLDLAKRHVAGEAVDFEALFPGGREVVELPPTPLERRRYWIDAELEARSAGSPISLDADLRAGHAPRAEREAALTAFLLEQLGEMLHLPPSAIATEVDWVRMGIDSLRATELSNRVRAALGLSLPTKTVFEHPTPARLAAYLAAQQAAAEEPPEAGLPSAAGSFEEGLV